MKMSAKRFRPSLFSPLRKFWSAAGWARRYAGGGRSLRRTQGGAPPTLELLEDRTVPTVTWDLTAGRLSIIGEGHDSITVTVETGEVQVNAAPTGAAAADVAALLIVGGDGDDQIDASEATASVFTSLANGAVTLRCFSFLNSLGV